MKIFLKLRPLRISYPSRPAEISRLKIAPLPQTELCQVCYVELSPWLIRPISTRF